jgi:hypothetical protein
VEQIGKAVIRLNMLSYMEAEQMILWTVYDTLNTWRCCWRAKHQWNLQKLAPTERAAYFRVYGFTCKLTLVEAHQPASDAMGLEIWWYHTNTRPVLTDMDAAPESLLKFVRWFM